MALQKKIIIKWLLTTMWVVAGTGMVVLLVAAVKKRDAEHCKGINVNIKGVDNNFFVDKKDIIDSIAAITESNPIGEPISSFNLKLMEDQLIKNIWVKKAELFFDNNETLQVNVTEREPVARIFTTEGTTFYIDTSVAMLPLSEKFSARLPVFTGFPSDRKVLSKADSSLLKDVKTISLAIQKDSFSMALIDQVDITSQRTFEFVPKLGNNIIVFGDATNAEEKLNKIKVFYKEIMVKAGWNYYSVVNVEYKNQVVAKRKGADDVSIDSLRAIQMMQQIATNAEKAANDSLQTIMADNDKNTTDVNFIQQSIQRDDNSDFSNPFKKPKPQDPVVTKPVVVKPAVVPTKPATVVKKTVVLRSNPVPVKKPVVTKPATTNPKPVEQKPKSAPAPIQTPKPVQKKKTETKPNNDY